MAHGTHDFDDDARNDHILIWVNGELVPRERAVVSVFDAGFVLGDGVWEGLRVRAGHPAFLERHLDRLFEGATAIMLAAGRWSNAFKRCTASLSMPTWRHASRHEPERASRDVVGPAEHLHGDDARVRESPRHGRRR